MYTRKKKAIAFWWLVNPLLHIPPKVYSLTVPQLQILPHFSFVPYYSIYYHTIFVNKSELWSRKLTYPSSSVFFVTWLTPIGANLSLFGSLQGICIACSTVLSKGSSNASLQNTLQLNTQGKFLCHKATFGCSQVSNVKTPWFCFKLYS